VQAIEPFMLKKISREDCLKKYPLFPLWHYDEDRDEEDFFYPDIISGQWIELSTKNDEDLTIKLAKELTSLFKSLGIEYLVFLGDTEQPWLSTMALERKEYMPLVEAVGYFMHHQFDAGFNGGTLVSIDNLEVFLIHFYTLVRCDASLPYFHFIDNSQQILGTIHYSGQIRIDRFHEQANQLLEKHISNTPFNPVKK
jgi:hypothetical protein